MKCSSINLGVRSSHVACICSKGPSGLYAIWSNTNEGESMSPGEDVNHTM